jgi:hypothetical protein
MREGLRNATAPPQRVAHLFPKILKMNCELDEPYLMWFDLCSFFFGGGLDQLAIRAWSRFV